MLATACTFKPIPPELDGSLRVARPRVTAICCDDSVLNWAQSCMVSWRSTTCNKDFIVIFSHHCSLYISFLFPWPSTPPASFVYYLFDTKTIGVMMEKCGWQEYVMRRLKPIKQQYLPALRFYPIECYENQLWRTTTLPLWKVRIAAKEHGTPNA